MKLLVIGHRSGTVYFMGTHPECTRFINDRAIRRKTKKSLSGVPVFGFSEALWIQRA